MNLKKLFDDKYIGYHTFGLKINCKLKELDTKHDYSKDYFTIEALGNGNVYFKYLSFATTRRQYYMEYSKDNGQTWTRTTNVDNEEIVMDIPLTTGEKVLVRGINETLRALYQNKDEILDFNSNFSSNILFNVYGNIMSLIHGDAFIGKTTVSERMFTGLFFDNWGDFNGRSHPCDVVDASNLILPATALANWCYSEMFNKCTMLTAAPELPATTLALNCYRSMFYGCTSLTTAPELPATTLAESCYASMFYGCTSLTTAPELPATTLASSCYQNMFNGCMSLTTAPELPARILTEECYASMFFNCTSLTTAPELPATTLANSCYDNMFNGCTSLTTAPELPATILAQYCYNEMFRFCDQLNYIKAMFTTKPSTSYTLAWVDGVAEIGTFVKNSAAEWQAFSTEAVPMGWTIQTVDA